MNRQYVAGLASIVLIVLIVAWNTSGPGKGYLEERSLAGSAFEVAVARGAYVSPGEAEPLRVVFQANSGSLPSHTTLVPRNGVVRFTVEGAASTSSGISLELKGSETATSADFTLLQGISSEGGFTNSAPLVASRSVGGVWYSFVSAEQLTEMRSRFGPGWYVFSANAYRGEEQTGSQRMAFFIP